MQKEESHFIVTYRDPENLTENITLKVKEIKDSTLGLSFISLSGFVFNQSTTIVDPHEENLKKRYSNTKSLHLSIYSIVSIEEVGSENSGLVFKKDKSNLLVMNSEKAPEKSPDNSH